MSKKLKLQTDIEKCIHKHVNLVKEGSIDFTVLYIRRNNIDVDRESLTKILDVFRKAVDNEHVSKLDIFMSDLDKTLESVVDED